MNTPTSTMQYSKNHLFWNKISAAILLALAIKAQAAEPFFDITTSFKSNYTSKIKDTEIETRSYDYRYNPKQHALTVEMQSVTSGFFSLFRAPYSLEGQILLLPEGKSLVTHITENDDDDITEITFNYAQNTLHVNNEPQTLKLPEQPTIISIPELGLASLMHHINHLIDQGQTINALQNSTVTMHMPYTNYESEDDIGSFFETIYTIHNINETDKSIDLTVVMKKTKIDKTFISKMQVLYEKAIYSSQGTVEQPDVPNIQYKLVDVQYRNANTP